MFIKALQNVTINATIWKLGYTVNFLYVAYDSNKSSTLKMLIILQGTVHLSYLLRFSYDMLLISTCTSTILCTFTIALVTLAGFMVIEL